MSGKPASNQGSLATPQEQRQETERMRDVFFLLENLFKREETTIKMILDCLYDVGSINYINQKLKSRILNRMLKWLVRFPKPIFRIVALRWVKKNAPELVTRWLHRKVKFVPPALPAPQAIAPQAAAPTAIAPQAESAAQPAMVTVVEPVALPAASLIKLNDYQYEIQRLHSQVNVLTALLVMVTVSLGGAFAWLMWKVELTPAQSVQPIKPAIARCIES